MSNEQELDRQLCEGENLFNRALFFECHEFLEMVWKGLQGNEKKMVQGLIQAAAGFYKFKLGSKTGCVTLLKKAADKLAVCAEFKGISLKPFTRDLLHSVEKIERDEFDLKNFPRMSLFCKAHI